MAMVSPCTSAMTLFDVLVDSLGTLRMFCWLSKIDSNSSSGSGSGGSGGGDGGGGGMDGFGASGSG